MSFLPKNQNFFVWILGLLLPLSLLQCAKKETQVEHSNNQQKKVIGLLIAGSDECYNAAADVFESRSKKEGWSVIRRVADYKKEKETLYIQEYMAKKVDAIAVITSDIVTAGQYTKKVREANIPIFFMMTLPQFDEGVKANGVVTIDWYQTGFLPAQYISHQYPKAQCVLIEGGYDQGMAELMRAGFHDGLKSNPQSQNRVVASVTGSWMKPNAMVAMDELLKNKEAFDCIFTGNEEMMLGVIESLQRKQLLHKYLLFSENGREDVGYKYLKSGVLKATVEAVTTKDGDAAFQMVKAYFEGKDIPYHLNNPVRLITAENVESLIPWNGKRYIEAMNKGQQFVDYTTLEVVAQERPWSREGNNYENIYFFK